jgi:hypothetical protein
MAAGTKISDLYHVEYLPYTPGLQDMWGLPDYVTDNGDGTFSAKTYVANGYDPAKPQGSAVSVNLNGTTVNIPAAMSQLSYVPVAFQYQGNWYNAGMQLRPVLGELFCCEHSPTRFRWRLFVDSI